MSTPPDRQIGSRNQPLWFVLSADIRSGAIQLPGNNASSINTNQMSAQPGQLHEVVRSTKVRTPASMRACTLSRARRSSRFPGYSPARSPGSTHQPWTKSSCVHVSSGSSPAPDAWSALASETIRSPDVTGARQRAGIPRRPNGRRRAGRRWRPSCRRRRRGWQPAGWPTRRTGLRRPPRGRLRGRPRSSPCPGCPAAPGAPSCRERSARPRDGGVPRSRSRVRRPRPPRVRR